MQGDVRVKGSNRGGCVSVKYLPGLFGHGLIISFTCAINVLECCHDVVMERREADPMYKLITTPE